MLIVRLGCVFWLVRVRLVLLMGVIRLGIWVWLARRAGLRA